MNSQSRPGGGAPSRGRPAGGGRYQGKKRTYQRKKICRFCLKNAQAIDYKDTRGLKYFITERGKIIPRRISGNCAKHQRLISIAVKRARNIALIPYVVSGV
ncbi:MAG: 30S ribosomal protein S18 [Thermodesulfobacteriota bacterium]